MRSFFFIAALLVGVAFVNVAQADVLVQKQGPVTVHHSARLDIDWCEGCVQLMLVVINEVVRVAVGSNGARIGPPLSHRPPYFGHPI